MRLKSVLLIAGLCCGSIVFGQSEAATSKTADTYTEATIQELGMNEKQAAQYRALVAQKQSELNEMRKSKDAGMNDRARELSEKHEQDLKAILTTEQWERYQNKKQAQHDKSVRRAEYLKEKQDEGRIKRTLKAE